MDNPDWQSFERPLRAFITRRVPKDAVDDVYGDVLLRLVSNRDKFQAADKPLAWLYKVTANIIADYYRTHSREQAVVNQEISADVAAQVSMENDRSATAELAECVLPFIANLPEPYRQSLIMTEINGMKQVDAARKLGLSESGLKSRVQRGRAQLKEAIQKCCEVRLNRKGNIVDYDKKQPCC